MRKSRFVVSFVVVAVFPLLLPSCATNKVQQQAVDPIAALSYSSEGAVPVAFAVIPSTFILPALEEIRMNASANEVSPAAEFLDEFFSRADCVFLSIMHNSNGDALFCRALALGKFPARVLRLMLSASRGWERRKDGDAQWYESSTVMEDRTLRAAIPASGVVLAEIDIVPPSSNGEDGAVSSSMANFVAAATSPPSDTQAFDRGGDGAGAIFFSSVDAVSLGADSVPFALYAPDFNLFARSVLPLMPDFPLAGAVEALSSLEGFSLPISSVEFTVEEIPDASAEEPDRSDRLTVRTTVPSNALMRAAAFIVQLMFPEDSVTAENGAITVIKDVPAGRAALAVLSFFLVS